jgi:hypothetical protein
MVARKTTTGAAAPCKQLGMNALNNSIRALARVAAATGGRHSNKRRPISCPPVTTRSADSQINFNWYHTYMKRIIAIIIGLVITAFGAYALFVSMSQLLQGQWIWFVLVIASGALILFGVRLTRGEKLRDILDDLLFVLIRTN